jgi:hypothetical protein
MTIPSSSTYVQQETIPEEFSYGDKTNVTCNVAFDTLHIAKKSIPNKGICTAYVLESFVPSTDGIIGLAPPGDIEMLKVAIMSLESTIKT